MLTLYSYFRSSTAYRVRIGLNLKGLEYALVPVNLLKGEQAGGEYGALNPSGAVPALVHEGFVLTQSLAILNYIDNLAPEPPLAAGSHQELAYVREVALAIATDIHPLTNMRVLKYLTEGFGADEAGRNKWYSHWARQGMRAVEAHLAQRGWPGDFCLGNRISVADLCLVPQMYNMRRYKLPLADYPICRRIEENCMKIEAFQRAAPEMQPDAPADLEPIHGPSFRAA